jgi:hypothetical protein
MPGAGGAIAAACGTPGAATAVPPVATFYSSS